MDLRLLPAAIGTSLPVPYDPPSVAPYRPFEPWAAPVRIEIVVGPVEAIGGADPWSVYAACAAYLRGAYPASTLGFLADVSA